jgi:O-antigen/teichoic acid export membrane protein
MYDYGVHGMGLGWLILLLIVVALVYFVNKKNKNKQFRRIILHSLNR